MKKLLEILMSVALAIGIVAPQGVQASLYPDGMNRVSQTLRTVRSQAARYMVASNRFGIPTDVGTSDAGYASGTTYLGGNGTANIGDYHERRWKFSTTWAPLAGRFLWGNVTLVPAGLANIQAGFTFERGEIRKVSDGTLVDTVKFAGSASHSFAAGEVLASDPEVDLAANTDYYLDLYWTGGRNSGWPAFGANVALLQGEVSKTATTDLSGGTMAASGNSFAQGPNLAPVAFLAKGWDGSPVAGVVGDSREDQTNIYVQGLTRDIGHVAQALGSATGGRMNYWEGARYSTALLTLYSPTGASGTTTYGLFDWMASAMSSQFGQTKPPFQLIYSEHGTNSLNQGASASGMVGLYQAAKNKATSLWPGIPWVQETITPFSKPVSSTYTATTNEADQVGAITASSLTASGGWIEGTNTAIMGGAQPFDLGIDVATTVRSTSNYAAWKATGFTASLITAVTANAVSTVTLSAAPPIGAMLVFEPGTQASLDFAYTVIAVRANGSNFDVDLSAAGSNGLSGRTPSVARKVQVAHAAGVTVASAYSAYENASSGAIHQSWEGTGTLRDAIVARKSAIAALANAYVPQ